MNNVVCQLAICLYSFMGLNITSDANHDAIHNVYKLSQETKIRFDEFMGTDSSDVVFDMVLYTNREDFDRALNEKELTQHITGWADRFNNNIVMYCCYNDIIIHEMTHILMYHHYPYIISEYISEGFAQAFSNHLIITPFSRFCNHKHGISQILITTYGNHTFYHDIEALIVYMIDIDIFKHALKNEFLMFNLLFLHEDNFKSWTKDVCKNGIIIK